VVEQVSRAAGTGSPRTTGTAPTRRERQRRATMAEIVAAARDLIRDPDGSGFTLRSVAQRMGITAPALYRYVSSLQDLTELVAFDIDGDVAAELAAARDSQPADDPAARIICASIAFRRWALAHKAEFAVVFANPASEATCQRPEGLEESPTSTLFSELLEQLWHTYAFPVPRLEDLDPAISEALTGPTFPKPHRNVPREAAGLVWLFMRSWASLYGTVTLEVFGHLDSRVIESGAMFRAMLEDQARRFAIEHELPRLEPMILAEMSR
jgi:AcrR family transcriptional regulator